MVERSHKNKTQQSTANDLPVVILVDDEPSILSALKRSLVGINAQLLCFTSPLDALSHCREQRPDIVISDQRMPGMLGSDLQAEIGRLWPDSQRMLLSAHNDFDAVTEAFNNQAIGRYLSKPWDDQQLRFVLEKALDAVPPRHTADGQADAPVDVQVDGEDETTNFHGMVSGSAAMHQLFNDIQRAATASVPIFITGPTGAGKELAARACHQESYQHEHPFVATNCANFTEHLIESQLFGHTKGAFTGAVSNQQGLFATAGEGTLFLDEVTTLPLPFQAKLLRVIQEREFTPLGSLKSQPFKAQLVTASSTPLATAVERGEFREDLFYRLNVITIDLPPLSERDRDVLLIARYFLKRCNDECQKQFSGFSVQAERLLLEYPWPGNVRQLENLIRGVVAMNDGDQVVEEMLLKPLLSSVNGLASSPSVAPAPAATSAAQSMASGEIRSLADVERSAIEQAIAECDGNIPKAAALLGVSPSTIYRKKQTWEEC